MRPRLLLPFVLAVAALSAHGAGLPAASGGERIYREGRLGSGALLEAWHDGTRSEGAAAACVNCHRPSGLGSYEGTTTVPPIIGPYLFRSGAINAADLNLPHIPGYAPRPYAYTTQTLAETLRSGVAPDGRPLNALMPRYDLDDTAVRQLSDYLEKLSAGPFAGVDGQTLHFATVIAADADPAERAAVVTVLEHFFAERAAASKPRLQSLRPDAGEYRAVRSWRLHVWELTGRPDTWETQLQERFASQPVFAMVSGLAVSSWSPVARFCETHRVPCVFPNVDLAPVEPGDAHSVYFSRGVLVEADLLSTNLAVAARAEPASRARPPRMVQLFRAGDVGVEAAARLGRAARQAGFSVTDRELPAGAGTGGKSRSAVAARAQLRAALSLVHQDEILVLWLRPSDLAALPDPAPRVRSIYLSGQLAGLEEAPLSPAWRAAARMTYPYDPPNLRRVRENFSHAWLRKQGIPITHDRLQSNTYLSCSILGETLESMLDSYVPEFLLERLQTMVSMRPGTGYFPRLGLAPGQQFASKGGYIVRFTGGVAEVAAEGPWITP